MICLAMWISTIVMLYCGWKKSDVSQIQNTSTLKETQQHVAQQQSFVCEIPPRSNKSYREGVVVLKWERTWLLSKTMTLEDY